MKIVKDLVPSGKYSTKCPYAMTPEGITLHNTYNNASAKNEITYMKNNNNEVSYHFAVDDIEARQGIPLTRNSWNAGDGGSGYGNRKTIAIEICYSKSGGSKFDKAEENAAKLIAQLMVTYGWDESDVGGKKINTHKYRSGKYCPHRTLDKGISRFWGMVKEEYKAITKQVSKPTPTTKPPTTSTTTKYKVGDTVSYTGIYASSDSSKKLTPAIKKGKITKIVKNAKNPYLIGGGIGWVNDKVITTKSTSSSPSKPSAAPKKKSNKAIAKEVIAGKWGNGTARKTKLTKAGYNYSAIQKEVNKLLK